MQYKQSLILVSTVLSDYFARPHNDFFLFFPLYLHPFFRGVLSNHVLQDGKNILRLNHTIIFTQAKSLCSWLFLCIKVELPNELWAAGSVFIWKGMQSHIMTYRPMAWQILGKELICQIFSRKREIKLLYFRAHLFVLYCIQKKVISKMFYFRWSISFIP